MMTLKTLICTGLVTALCAGVTLAQTNPTPRTVPFTENFGTIGSATAPTGFAAWSGLSGNSISTQVLAEGSAQTTNATISTATPSTTGAAYYFTAATGDGRIGVVTSSNGTNGVNQWILGLDTTGQTNISLAWKYYSLIVGTRTVGSVVQYRVGSTGAWTTLSGTNNPYTQINGVVGTITNASVTLPTLAENQPVVQVRWAVWRGNEAGGSSGFAIDDLVATSTGGTGATGACCAGDGTCTGPVTAGNCTGTYQGNNTTCGSVTCPVSQGACCNAQGGLCNIVASAASCVTPNAFLGTGSVCGTNAANCANGACCQTNGNCAVTLSAGCDAPSIFQAGTCSPTNPCPQPGACCNATTGVCTLVLQSACTGALTWNGASTCSNASPFTCPQPIGACCNTNSGTCGVVSSDLCAANGFFGPGTTCATIVSCTPPQVVISQIYGGGGNGGATYTNDFVELFNRGHTPVSINGWSIQYASTSGTTWQTLALGNTTLQPGQYYLIQLAAGTTVTNAPLPITADLSGNINMSGTNGKVALSRLATGLTGGCAATAGVVADFVGFGTADCREGASSTNNAPAPASASVALIRNSGGCADTNNNANDFTATQSPAPHNTGTISECAAGNPPSGSGVASPNPACAGTTVVFTVTTVNGTDPVASVAGDFSALGGNNPESFTNSAANTWTFSLSLPNVTQQLWQIPVTITDNGNRTATTNIALTVSSCNASLSSATADPNYVCNGTQTRLFVTATPGPNSSAANLAVNANLSSLSASAPSPAVFTRVGTSNVFEYFVTTDASLTVGAKTITLNLTDNAVAADTRNVTVTTAPCTNATSQIVISQVFGGGGNSGANYKYDFVELFNRSGVPVSINGWSLQYGSDTDAGFSGPIGSNGNSNAPVALSGTIQPGKYYLIQLAAGANGSALDLPTPDLIGVPAIPLSSSAGRIALVRNSVAPLGTTAGGACSNANIEDFVGYGTTAECYEGDSTLGPTPGTSNTAGIFRRQNGCQDTNRNVFDFFLGDPAPRNSATAANNCVPVASGVCCRGATCSTGFADQTACSAAGPVLQVGASNKFIASATCNVLGNNVSPCCYANYNHNATLEVQDIFDFLNDWFAGKKIAIPGGDGVTGTLAVQNIFDFLNAWFAGGCN